MVSKSVAVEIIYAGIREALDQAGQSAPEGMTEDTVIVGPNAVLDSLGVVSLIVEVEQALEQKHDVSVTLASDKAMSARNSPFRTVGVFADHVLATIAEGAAHG